MRIHLLLVGSPFQLICNTTPFWPHSNLPTSLQTLLRNQTVEMWFRSHHQCRGNPSHGHGSTTLFCQHSNPPANWHIPQHNCMGLQGVVVLWGTLADKLAGEEAWWADMCGGGSQVGTWGGIPYGAHDNTTPSWLHPRNLLHRWRN